MEGEVLGILGSIRESAESANLSPLTASLLHLIAANGKLKSFFIMIIIASCTINVAF